MHSDWLEVSYLAVEQEVAEAVEVALGLKVVAHQELVLEKALEGEGAGEHLVVETAW